MLPLQATTPVLRGYGRTARYFRNMATKQIDATQNPRPPVSWLNEILKSTDEPPKLFSWTAANLGPSHVAASAYAVGRTTTTPDVQLTTTGTAKERIYVLGIGNLGRLFASALASVPERAPITLIVHRKALLEQWAASPGIEITQNGKVKCFPDFDVVWLAQESPPHGPVKELPVIKNLIVSTKASDSMPAVDRLRRYLNRTSTVAFVQNGMCKMWPPVGQLYQNYRYPDRTSRPSWLTCVTTHGVRLVAPFKSVHAAVGTVSVGPVSVNEQWGHNEQNNPSSYLLNQIAQAAGLYGQVVSTSDLWLLQLEKLVLNSIINPLTAIIGCNNGEIFIDRGDKLPMLIDMLIKEASSVLTKLVEDSSSSEILNGADGINNNSHPNPSVYEQAPPSHRVSFSSLRAMVYEVGHKVGKNTSSMLQDVRAGRRTEIQDFNGWLIETAEVLNMTEEVPTHRKIVSVTENYGDRNYTRKELAEYCLSHT